MRKLTSLDDLIGFLTSECCVLAEAPPKAEAGEAAA